jgi:hypothetical protein
MLLITDSLDSQQTGCRKLRKFTLNCQPKFLAQAVSGGPSGVSSTPGQWKLRSEVKIPV